MERTRTIALAALLVGACTNRTADDSSIEKRRAALTEFGAARSVSAGLSHNCAVLDTAGVVCWGRGTEGQLGTGLMVGAPEPTAVVGLTDAVSVTTGVQHSCARRAGGSVVCWGDGTHGALGDGAGATSSVPVAVSGLTDAASVSAGGYFSVALRQNGTVVWWGYDGYADQWAGSMSLVPVAVPGIDDAVAISAYWNHACALRPNGQVVCWGLGTSGQLGDGNGTSSLTPVTVQGLSDAVAVSAGSAHTCAVRAGGAVVCWGAGPAGQLGDGGTRFSDVPVTVVGLADAVSVSAGHLHVCALRETGGVACWGGGAQVHLGDGVSTSSQVPVDVSGLSDAIGVSAGNNHTCAMRSNGTVACWGSGDDGELGNGVLSSSVPVAVSGLSARVPGDGGDASPDAGDGDPPDGGPTLLAEGTACGPGDACASGFCTDGVCCQNACGNGAFDCQACSIAAGADANGVCTQIPMCVMAPAPECTMSPCNTVTLTDSSMGGYTVTITFPAGMMAGDVRVTPCDVDTVPPPSEYEIAGGTTTPACWDLHTTATYPHSSWPPSPPPPDLIVCISYPPEVVEGLDDLTLLQLAHFTSGGVTMITTDRPSGQVCGTTSSLSPFAILLPRDRTRPVFSGVPGPIVVYATSTAGATVTYPTPNAVDATDGALPVTCTPASGSTFPLGQSNVTCTATDTIGNKATATIPVWVQVQAPAGGAFFLPPINPDGTSIFKGGTIPVKFRLTGASAAIGNLVARHTLAKVSSAVTGSDVEATASGAANEGNVFRYDPVARQYVYNLSTKPLSSGTWSLRVDLGDGVAHQVNVSLKSN